MKKNIRTAEQIELDERIHQTIKKCCALRVPVRLEIASLAFDFLSRNASPIEIERHKSEYILLFSRMVASLDKEKELYAPKVVELTDWFFSRTNRRDSGCRSRLKNIVQMMDAKGLPVPQAKKDAWKKQLAPVRKPVASPRPFLDPPEPCPCVLFGPQKLRIVAKD